jgi:hypothetical protein
MSLKITKVTSQREMQQQRLYGRRNRLGHVGVIHVTPAPVLAGLERLDDGVLGVMKMGAGMLVLRGVTTADVAANQAFSQVDPGITHLQAFLAALAAGGHVTDLFYMGTGRLCLGHRSPPVN